MSESNHRSFLLGKGFPTNGWSDFYASTLVLSDDWRNSSNSSVELQQALIFPVPVQIRTRCLYLDLGLCIPMTVSTGQAWLAIAERLWIDWRVEIGPRLAGPGGPARPGYDGIADR